MVSVPVGRFCAVLVLVLLGISCAPLSPMRFQHPSSWRGSPSGGHTRFNQSCTACGAPVSASTGELLVPATTQAARTFTKVVEAAEIIQGFITVSRFLDEAEKAVVEDILKECVQEANRKVDDELFGKGRSLPDSECEKEPPVRNKLAPTWARHLGMLKHAAAFECIQRRLSERFPENFAIEPRLRKDAVTQEVMLTNQGYGSLKPDIVIHFTRRVTQIQCIYDLKFPCGYAVGSNPWSTAADVQMRSYGGLGGECYPALITPQHGVVRRQAGR